MTTLDAVLTIEGGCASEEELIDAFQALIDSGAVWHLQGSYGRTAATLLSAGLCSPRVLRETSAEAA